MPFPPLLLLAGCHAATDRASTDAPPVVTDLPRGPLPAPAGTLFLFGTEGLDQAGREIDVGDADGDGLDDVLVAAPSVAVYGYGESTTTSSAYVLRAPIRTGPLDEVADGRFPARYIDDNEGASSAILVDEHMLLLSNNGDGSVLARAFDGAAQGTLTFDEASATIDAHAWGEVGRQHLEDCHGAALGVGGVCWTSTSWQDNA